MVDITQNMELELDNLKPLSDESTQAQLSHIQKSNFDLDGERGNISKYASGSLNEMALPDEEHENGSNANCKNVSVDIEKSVDASANINSSCGIGSDLDALLDKISNIVDCKVDEKNVEVNDLMLVEDDRANINGDEVHVNKLLLNEVINSDSMLTSNEGETVALKNEKSDNGIMSESVEEVENTYDKSENELKNNLLENEHKMSSLNDNPRNLESNHVKEHDFPSNCNETKSLKTFEIAEPGLSDVTNKNQSDITKEKMIELVLGVEEKTSIDRVTEIDSDESKLIKLQKDEKEVEVVVANRKDEIDSDDDIMFIASDILKEKSINTKLEEQNVQSINNKTDQLIQKKFELSDSISGSSCTTLKLLNKMETDGANVVENIQFRHKSIDEVFFVSDDVNNLGETKLKQSVNKESIHLSKKSEYLKKPETNNDDNKIKDVFVVILEDDDDIITKKSTDENSVANTEPTLQSQSSEGQSAVCELITDNTDNAYDQCEKQQNSIVIPGHIVGAENDTNSISRCNLLQSTSMSLHKPRIVKSSEIIKNVTEGSDLMKLQADDKEATDPSIPPIKRIRLSDDEFKEKNGKTIITNQINGVHKVNTDVVSVTIAGNLKRTRISLDDDSESKTKKNHSNALDNEAPIKKNKTEETVENDNKISINGVEAIQNSKFEIKAVQDEIPNVEKEQLLTEGDLKIEGKFVLYPPPKLETDVEPLSLEFFKLYRKAFDKMTTNDLEDLVLLKVVEALQFKSQFKELDEQCKKYEKVILNYRRKLSELTKQFADLEMVNNRLLTDLDARNSHIIMPVKITRAVGLQVGAPFKKTNEAPPSVSGSVVNEGISTGITTRGAVSAQQQRNNIAGLDAKKPEVLSAVATGTRRGCMQKITPQRPIVNTPVATTPYRNPIIQSVPQKTPPKVLNKHAVGMGSTTVGMPVPRGRPPSVNSDLQQQYAVRQHQQQHVQRQNMGNNFQKTGLKTSLPALRRSDPIAQPAVSKATSSNANVFTNVSVSNLTSAKPKEKGVIDLTDEDDSEAAALIRQQQQQQPAQQRMSLPASIALRQRVPISSQRPTQQQPHNARPLAVGTPSLRTANLTQQATPVSVQRSSTNNLGYPGINTPPGTSITRVQLSANNPATSRFKYSHPAPLPTTPPQTYNPDWKLPPPRPTIRISLLDNGIVISWTMEETMERHAECVSYQIYAYQETRQPPSTELWRHVGDVKSMLLPMAVTLNQFQENQRYYFAVRAVDEHQRFGPFSLPKTWS